MTKKNNSVPDTQRINDLEKRIIFTETTEKIIAVILLIILFINVLFAWRIFPLFWIMGKGLNSGGGNI